MQSMLVLVIWGGCLQQMVHARMLKPVALTRDTLAAHVETAAGAVAYGKDPAPGKHVEDADGKFKFMDICKSAKCGLT